MVGGPDPSVELLRRVGVGGAGISLSPLVLGWAVGTVGLVSESSGLLKSRLERRLVVNRLVGLGLVVVVLLLRPKRLLVGVMQQGLRRRLGLLRRL